MFKMRVILALHHLPPTPFPTVHWFPKKRIAPTCWFRFVFRASHIAFGSIRMEPVFMILGQSAAVAASMAIDKKCAVQDISYDELKTILEAKKQVLTYTLPH
jgi:hypothetical protein